MATGTSLKTVRGNSFDNEGRSMINLFFQIDWIFIVLEERIKCEGQEIRCWRFCLS
jgi:hypothetical protein